MRKSKRSPGAVLLDGVLRWKGRLPLGYHYFWGSVAAWFFTRVLRYRKAVVEANLARSFPELDNAAREAVKRRFYARLGEIFAETVWFAGCRGERGIARFRRQGIIRTLNPELLNRFHDTGRSVMVFASHTGNWELLGSLLSAPGPVPFTVRPEDIAVVYKRLSSRVWDEALRDNRCGIVAHTGFDGYVESKQMLRFALEHRDEPRVYLFPNDQAPYAGSTRTAIGTFLHQETQAMTGGAALARKLGMAVVYLRFRCEARGRYTVEYVPLCDDAAPLSTDELLRRYYMLLEADITAQPFNYLWSHRRWK